MNQQIPNITSETIKNYQRDISHILSRSSVKRKVSSLNKFVKWANQEGYVQSNTMVIPDLAMESSVGKSILSGSQLPKILAWFSFTAGLGVFVFVGVNQLSNPIPFRTAPAQEATLILPSSTPLATPVAVSDTNLISDIDLSSSPSPSPKNSTATNTTNGLFSVLDSVASMSLTRLSVDNDLDLGGNLNIGGVTRFNSDGRLASITGYYQDSGLFEVDQGAPDWASISKTLTSSMGAASSDVLTLTLDESDLTTGSNYDTLVLNRSGEASGGYALYVDTGDVLLDNNLDVGGTLSVTNISSLGTLNLSGQLTASNKILAKYAPTSAHTGTWATGSSTWNQANASIYINPSSATADSNLFAGAVNGSVKFSIDAEGDIYANNLILEGTTTTGTSTIAGDLTVEGNTVLGDASTDTFTINPNAITVTNATNFDLKDTTVGSLTFESTLLSLDTNNSRVGIGNAAPTAKLDVTGSATVSGTLAVGVMNQVDAGTCNAASEGQMYYDKGQSTYYQCNGSSWASIGTSEEAGQIAAFNGSCPTGWSEVTAARGRYIVGTPASGTNGATVGTALTDQENRPTGKHTHGITDPGHSHTQYIRTSEGGSPGGDSIGSDIATTTTTYTNTTGITVDYTVDNCDGGTSTCTVAGTNAPYIQYTYCSKDAGADLAEWITADTDYSPGTIVSANPVAIEQVMASNEAYDPKVIGIVATKPGWILGEKKENSVLLALAGRVPTIIAADSQEIKVGDPIAVSSTAGAGMKATKTGWIVGTALEDWTPESHKDKIIVFVNPSWWDQTFIRNIGENGELLVNGQKVEFTPDEPITTPQEDNESLVTKVEKASYYFYLGSEEVFTKVGVFSDLVAANIEAGGAEIKNLLADSIRTTKIISPVVETSFLSPIPDSDLTVTLAGNSQFKIQNTKTKEVTASIDNAGNATFSGEVRANKLYATNLTQIEATLKKAEDDIGLLTDQITAEPIQKVNQDTSIDQVELVNVVVDKLNLLLANTLKIDANGDVSITGNLYVAGKITTQDIETNRLVIASDTPSVTSQIESNQIESNAAAGSARIASGSAEVVIKNSKVSGNSLIYVTPTTPSNNQVLYIKGKQDGNFTVGFDQPIQKGVEFNWWVVDLLTPSI